MIKKQTIGMTMIIIPWLILLMVFAYHESKRIGFKKAFIVGTVLLSIVGWIIISAMLIAGDL